ncbi:MAG: PadR family transcriptional regulator, partial [Bacillota bacterium]|nr:PadR family transcriptional regulator [Bacillota bacterium]
MDAQMKKGVLEMCILFKLKDEPLYGYEIMKSVRQVFPDVYEGSIYTILRRLNATGYTDITHKESTNG